MSYQLTPFENDEELEAYLRDKQLRNIAVYELGVAGLLYLK